MGARLALRPRVLACGCARVHTRDMRVCARVHLPAPTPTPIGGNPMFSLLMQMFSIVLLHDFNPVFTPGLMEDAPVLNSAYAVRDLLDSLGL